MIRHLHVYGVRLAICIVCAPSQMRQLLALAREVLSSTNVLLYEGGADERQSMLNLHSQDQTLFIALTSTWEP